MSFKILDNIYFSFVEQTFKVLFNQNSTIDNKIYVTMLWDFQQLKGICLNHVTCIAYGLRRICESIRENYNSVNDFIAALKKILVKAPSHQVLYQEVTELHLPQFPVIARWGTWIRCTVFLCENLTTSNALDSTEAAAIKQVQQLVTNKDLEFIAWLQVLA